MKSRLSLAIARPHKQQGATLFIALVFLVLLTIVGLSMFQTTTIEERMARNYTDYNVAFQAAEAALRDAELRVTGDWIYADTAAANSASPKPLNSIKFAADCTGGLCSETAARSTGSIITSYDLLTADDTTSGAKSVKVGKCPAASDGGCDGNGNINSSCSGTCSPAISGVARQPRYLIERLPYIIPGAATGDLSTNMMTVRVSAVGYGRSVDTRVILQSFFIYY